ncbi:nuclear transport factor 2 family protein [Cupriavidus sp. UYPR2.512]|uniref:nuclear transport factor 2 family protein n=1 Tax=Cupriavidus sp. UYPR2.512 TaxID=1080187 RepID=UPI00037E5257|nr:nuclear transport factor 2 family protein [Cupriavidus sp. UYPR2.512]UIF84726.1 nuclear transport factor 2 family protein [Cupriavidus necator]
MDKQIDTSTGSGSDRVKVFREFIDSLVAQDMERFFAIWHDDAVLEIPYAPAGHPNRLEGKAALRAYLKDFPNLVAITGFPEQTLYELQDVSKAIAEVSCSGKVLSNGNDYNISYVWVFEVRDGLLYRLRDYWNPLAVLGAMGGAEALKNVLGEH